MAFVSSAVTLRPSLLRQSICASTMFGARVTSRTTPTKARITMENVLPVFVQAMEDYKNDFRPFAERGWGATVKAERWNGRHAMFGFLVIILTGYCKGHGLLPDSSELLDVTQWGVVASLGDTTMITQERAIMLVAHIHVLFVSIAAALAPFSFQDKLLLEPGEEDEAPAGLFPPFEPGLTKGAELWNGRVSMLGLICIVGISAATGTPILDVVNIGIGKILY